MLLKPSSPFISSTLLVLIYLTVAGCAGGESQPTPQAEGGTDLSIQLTSSAFAEGSPIPAKYTCDGEDVSPPLRWSEVPQSIQSIALIADDPDAPGGTWVHWVLYGIPPDVTELTEEVPSTETLASGARHGTNDFRRLGYGGPCPPRGGPHRYFFKLYALNTELDLEPGATKEGLLRAMEGHILAQGQLMGRYQRR